MARNVTVIGAGVVGMACAVSLLGDGHAVTVIDRDTPGEGCSKGNAGIIAVGSCVPAAMPGVLWRVPGWLFDPLGPLSIRWSHLPALLPWLVRFARAARRQTAEAASAALGALHRGAAEEHAALARRVGAAHLVARRGYLEVYETAAAFEKDAPVRRLRERQGVAMEILGPGDIRQAEPALAPIFRHGVLIPDGAHTPDPWRLVRALADHFAAAGGTLRQAEVTGTRLDADGRPGVVTEDGDFDCDALVVAAGAWSRRLAAGLGAPVPLETERGYHVTVADPAVVPSRPVMSGEYKFAATPMESGLRFAGTDEFAGLAPPPDYARARVLLKHGLRMFPGLRASRTSEWMGHRPSLPDGLPVIGPSPRSGSVYFAFGHGHTGLTAAPRTGRIIADLVAGRRPPIDIAPFRADRF